MLEQEIKIIIAKNMAPAKLISQYFFPSYLLQTFYRQIFRIFEIVKTSNGKSQKDYKSTEVFLKPITISTLLYIFYVLETLKLFI